MTERAATHHEPEVALSLTRSLDLPHPAVQPVVRKDVRRLVEGGLPPFRLDLQRQMPVLDVRLATLPSPPLLKDVREGGGFAGAVGEVDRDERGRRRVVVQREEVLQRGGRRRTAVGGGS